MGLVSPRHTSRSRRRHRREGNEQISSFCLKPVSLLVLTQHKVMANPRSPFSCARVPGRGPGPSPLWGLLSLEGAKSDQPCPNPAPTLPCRAPRAGRELSHFLHPLTLCRTQECSGRHGEMWRGDAACRPDVSQLSQGALTPPMFLHTGNCSQAPACLARRGPWVLAESVFTHCRPPPWSIHRPH